MSSNLKKWKITEKIHIKNIGEVPIFDITKDGAELIVSNDKNLAVFRILDSEDHAMYNNSESSVECMVTFYNESTPLHVPIYSSYLMKGIDILQINKKRVVYQGYNHPNEPLYLRPPPPKDAYVIGGHGGETTSYGSFIVPRDCIIIVGVQSGEVAEDYNLKKIFYQLSRLDSHILCDPIHNMDKIKSAFGKQPAIFEPGEECPNFSYEMLSCHGYSKPYMKCHCDSLMSGMIHHSDLPLGNYSNLTHQQYLNQIIKDQQTCVDMHALSIYDKKEYILDSFFDSENTWPNREIVSKICDHIISEDNNPNPPIEDILQKLARKLTTFQIMLCNKRPGVYYHIVCRYSGKVSSDIYEKQEHTTNNIYSAFFQNKRKQLQQFVSDQEKDIRRIRRNESVQIKQIREKIKELEQKEKQEENLEQRDQIRKQIKQERRRVENWENTKTPYIKKIEDNIKDAYHTFIPAPTQTIKPEYNSIQTLKRQSRQKEGDHVNSKIRLLEKRITNTFHRKPHIRNTRSKENRNLENVLREKAHQNAMTASTRRNEIEKEGGKRRTRKRSKPTRRHST